MTRRSIWNLAPVGAVGILALVAVLLAAACGGGSGTPATTSEQTPTMTRPAGPAEAAPSTKGPTAAASAAPTPVATVSAGRKVSFDISLNDNFFQPNAFTVQPGDSMTFNVTNQSAQKSLHLMHIAGVDNVFERAVNPGPGDDVATLMVSPGQAVSLSWTAPASPGVYNFKCAFHTEMKGTITVK